MRDEGLLTPVLGDRVDVGEEGFRGLALGLQVACLCSESLANHNGERNACKKRHAGTTIAIAQALPSFLRPQYKGLRRLSFSCQPLSAGDTKCAYRTVVFTTLGRSYPIRASVIRSRGPSYPIQAKLLT